MEALIRKYDRQADFEEMCRPSLTKIKETCEMLRIPFYFVCAVGDNGKETHFAESFLLPQKAGRVLSQDKITSVPPADITVSRRADSARPETVISVGAEGNTAVFPDYDRSGSFEEKARPALEHIRNCCIYLSMPFYFIAAVSQTGEKTCYEEDLLTAWSAGTRLSEDRILACMRASLGLTDITDRPR